METEHIMPNDILPSYLSKEEKEAIENRLTTTNDLMMIRTYRVKQLFEKLGVPKSQISPIAGKNLGMTKSNQKVILKYY